MDDTRTHPSKWLLMAVSGLVMTGAGLCMCIDAGLSRMAGLPWFWYGTASLVVFQSGLCLMIDSSRHRARIRRPGPGRLPGSGDANV